MTQSQIAPFPLTSSSLAPWRLPTRIAFRLCFVYFSLYCLLTQIIGSLLPIPNWEFPELGTVRPIEPIVSWVANRFFHSKLPLVFSGSGSGDKTFDWVLVLCLLVFAAGATAVWSIFDRHRQNYAPLYKWFRLFMRFALAGQMFAYGIAKAVPLQMPFPFLNQLLEPFGNFSPMGVLWSSVGASPAFEICTGCAELLAGILLTIPATTLLGTLVCLVDMTFVFILNMTYDVPVKLLSFHLILLAFLLLTPEFRRMADFFLRDRPVSRSSQRPLFASLRANKIAVAAQLVFAVALLGANAYSAWKSWSLYGGARPKSPLYGIWNVDEFSIDGQSRPPVLTDKERFHRAIFDFPAMASVQLLDGTFVYYGAEINAKDRTVMLKKRNNKLWTATFTYQHPKPDALIFDGKMEGRLAHLELRLMDRNSFLLVNRGFHWVQEYPFNR